LPRAAMTPLVFSAQFQQRPIPLEGNLIKREWIRYFRGNVSPRERDYFVISWDTAMNASELADYSVGTVWHVQVRGRKAHLVDLVRGRFEYPEWWLPPWRFGESGRWNGPTLASSLRTRARDRA
jgi:phage terminase large subunit-like protein